MTLLHIQIPLLHRIKTTGYFNLGTQMHVKYAGKIKLATHIKLLNRIYRVIE